MKHNYFKWLLPPIALTLVICASMVLSNINISFAEEQPAAVSNEPVLLDYGTVVKIIKPTVIMLENQKTYSLDNLRVPIYYREDAIKELEELILNKKVMAYHYPEAGDEQPEFGGKALKKDRHGTRPAQIILEENNVWVQDHMIAKGLAWAFATRKTQRMIGTLKKSEYIARRNRQGFWDAKLYRVKNTEEVKRYLNSYQIVEGTVVNVTRKNISTYINFGADWRTDFTITVPNKYMGDFYNVYEEFVPEKLEGEKIKIRGWVEDKNGPMITYDYFGQIDIFAYGEGWEKRDDANQ